MVEKHIQTPLFHTSSNVIMKYLQENHFVIQRYGHIRKLQTNRKLFLLLLETLTNLILESFKILVHNILGIKVNRKCVHN